MSAPRRLAISYSRFSSPRQAHGDSEDRQGRMFTDFCGRHDLTPVAEVFADRGRSGYTDEHRKKGRLGQLIGLANAGRLEPGTVIVVEAWDRLGRLRPDRQTDLLAELLRTGVSIGVCRLDDIFSEEDFGTHKWTTLAIFIQLAHQESKQKAERVGASWDKRRERARETGAMLRCSLPAWVEMHDGKPRLIPERAAAIGRIFDLAGQGYGHTRIVARLEKERVPAFGEAVVRKGRTRSQFSGHWTRPYVKLILNDRRALGEFQPMKGDKPDGPPLAGYYPAAVSEEQFLLAAASQAQRKLPGDRTRQGSKYVNVFRGLLRHARDGEGFVLHNKGTAAAPELILVNGSGNGGRSRCWTFPYPVFETAVLRLLREVDPADVLPREAPSRLESLRAELTVARSELAQLQAELKAGFSKAIAAVLRDAEDREARVAERLQEELARSARPAEQAWQDLPGLADLIAGTTDPEGVRLRLTGVLRRVIEEGRLLLVRQGAFICAALQLFFVGGRCRNYLIVYKTAGYRRKGGWWCRSLALEIAGGDLDLRQPAHALALAARLEALDLDALIAG